LRIAVPFDIRSGIALTSGYSAFVYWKFRGKVAETGEDY